MMRAAATGILKNTDIMARLTEYSGKDKGWNDPCLLLSTDWTGKQLITENQTRAQFSLWAVMTAPLLISGSVLNMSNYTLETYSNSYVIAGIRICGTHMISLAPSLSLCARACVWLT